MSILITGSEGFLGTHTAHRLTAAGKQVVGLDVMPSKSARSWPVVAGDVTDRLFVERVFAEHNVTDVIHCGGVSGPHICNNFPARVFETNVLGTLNLLEVARTRRLSGRLVFLSSSSVYGQAAEWSSRKHPVVENMALLASEPYGASKVACEAMLRAYVTQERLDAISLRVSIVYGAGRTAFCGVTQMIKDALADHPILLDNGSDMPLPWVYIDDLTAALQAALDVPKSHLREEDALAYNVTGPGYPTFREIAEIIQELVPGAVIEETFVADKYAMNARKMCLAAITRDLGWVPRVSIREGVQKLFFALAPAKRLAELHCAMS